MGEKRKGKERKKERDEKTSLLAKGVDANFNKEKKVRKTKREENED